MPPTSPVLGRIKAYAKDANGNLYEIGGGSSVQKLDDLGDVDVVTTPPADGDTIVWDPVKGQWVPGPGGADEVAILGSTPTDPELELWVDTNATQGPITGTLQGGPGITVGTSADGSITEIRVDTGDGVSVTANGVSVNVDNVTIKVNATDQLEVIGAGTDFVAGPGMVVDDTQPPVVLFQVDTGEGIVITPAGVAVNADNITLQVDPLDDKLKLIAKIDHLADVDTVTVPPEDGWTLVWDAGQPNGGGWVPKPVAAAMTFVAGGGVTIGQSGNVTEIAVDTGKGIVVDADGVSANVDNVTIEVNATDQIALKAPIPLIAAGPGIVADGVTNPPTVTISVDPGAGIVQSPDGIAVNADNVTLAVDSVTDTVKLIAGIDHLSDVDTVTVAPTAQDSLIWDSTLPTPIWRPGVPITDGLTPKTPARATTTGTNILLDGTVMVLDTITLVVGDRVLVKDQTSPIENGLYDVAAGPWVRSADSNTEGSIVNGSAVFVSEGALYGGVNFVASVVAAEAPWTPDTDQSFWFIFSSKLDLTAGDGLVLVGRDIRVGAGEGIHVDPDSVRVDLGPGIVHSPDGITINTDGLTTQVNAQDQLIVDLGEGLIVGPNGVRVNTDNSTVTVNSSDQLVVDLGEGIVSTIDGIAVNTGLGLEVVADRLRVNRTVTDTWYRMYVQDVEPTEPWVQWVDTSQAVPIP